jgi:hypothetical protein
MSNVKNSYMVKQNAKELKEPILIVWIIISIITSLIILFPFFTDKQTVLQNTPTCISKSQFNIECSLCGMTRAFVEISNGNFDKAYKLNQGSYYLYISFLLNFTSFIIYSSYFTFRKIRFRLYKDTKISAY